MQPRAAEKERSRAGSGQNRDAMAVRVSAGKGVEKRESHIRLQTN